MVDVLADKEDDQAAVGVEAAIGLPVLGRVGDVSDVADELRAVDEEVHGVLYALDANRQRNGDVAPEELLVPHRFRIFKCSSK